MKYFKIKISVFLLLSLAITSCTEQYAFKTTDFESALVVEGTITNELKNQTIKVSQVYQLEETALGLKKELMFLSQMIKAMSISSKKTTASMFRLHRLKQCPEQSTN